MKHKSSDKYTDQAGPKPNRQYNIERFFMCMCAHHSMEHERKKGPCEVRGCYCIEADAANELYLIERQRLVENIGFNQHINEEATCLWCYERVSIGRWHDPLMPQRALAHARRSCKAVRKPPKPRELPCPSKRLKLVCR